MTQQSVWVADGHLEVSDDGTGEAIVFIQTALTADELRPLAVEPALADYRRIVYHRRGYAGSSPVDGPRTIPDDAVDCVALLDAVGINRAHIVGVSFSAAVGLQLAADFPERVHTVTVLEPPPVLSPSAPEFRAASDRLLATRRERGVGPALDEFLTMLVGPDWRHVTEQQLPGSVPQMQRDATTFFDTDMPALLGWNFNSDDAARVDCPVLYIGGTDSGPWFAAVREVVLDWYPHADDVTIEGADHSLAITHPRQIGGALLAFLERHPM